MNGRGDDVQAYALAVVFGIVGLVVAGVLALAAARLLPGSGEAGARGVERIDFAADGETLAAEAHDVLIRLADRARGDAQLQVLITGVLDASGDSAVAQKRALRVRHALEADGVAPAQLVLGKPAVRRSRSAARVEVMLQ